MTRIEFKFKRSKEANGLDWKRKLSIREYAGDRMACEITYRLCNRRVGRFGRGTLAAEHSRQAVRMNDAKEELGRCKG